jgi:3D (Asp-Asp-Asp) domain-containing protein
MEVRCIRLLFTLLLLVVATFVDHTAPASHYTVTSTCYSQGSTTASGQPVRFGDVANNFLPFGTRIRLDHPVFDRRVFTVEDRIGSGSELDIYNSSETACIGYGRHTIGFTVIPTTTKGRT